MNTICLPPLPATRRTEQPRLGKGLGHRLELLISHSQAPVRRASGSCYCNPVKGPLPSCHPSALHLPSHINSHEPLRTPPGQIRGKVLGFSCFCKIGCLRLRASDFHGPQYPWANMACLFRFIGRWLFRHVCGDCGLSTSECCGAGLRIGPHVDPSSPPAKEVLSRPRTAVEPGRTTVHGAPSWGTEHRELLGPSGRATEQRQVEGNKGKVTKASGANAQNHLEAVFGISRRKTTQKREGNTEIVPKKKTTKPMKIMIVRQKTSKSFVTAPHSRFHRGKPRASPRGL